MPSPSFNICRYDGCQNRVEDHIKDVKTGETLTWLHAYCNELHAALRTGHCASAGCNETFYPRAVGKGATRHCAAHQAEGTNRQKEEPARIARTAGSRKRARVNDDDQTQAVRAAPQSSATDRHLPIFLPAAHLPHSASDGLIPPAQFEYVTRAWERSRRKAGKTGEDHLLYRHNRLVPPSARFSKEVAQLEEPSPTVFSPSLELDEVLARAEKEEASRTEWEEQERAKGREERLYFRCHAGVPMGDIAMQKQRELLYDFFNIKNKAEPEKELFKFGAISIRQICHAKLRTKPLRLEAGAYTIRWLVSLYRPNPSRREVLEHVKRELPALLNRPDWYEAAAHPAEPHDIDDIILAALYPPDHERYQPAAEDPWSRRPSSGIGLLCSVTSTPGNGQPVVKYGEPDDPDAYESGTRMRHDPEYRKWLVDPPEDPDAIDGTAYLGGWKVKKFDGDLIVPKEGALVVAKVERADAHWLSGFRLGGVRFDRVA